MTRIAARSASRSVRIEAIVPAAGSPVRAESRSGRITSPARAGRIAEVGESGRRAPEEVAHRWAADGTEDHAPPQGAQQVRGERGRHRREQPGHLDPGHGRDDVGHRHPRQEVEEEHQRERDARRHLPPTGPALRGHRARVVSPRHASNTGPRRRHARRLRAASAVPGSPGATRAARGRDRRCRDRRRRAAADLHRRGACPRSRGAGARGGLPGHGCGGLPQGARVVRRRRQPGEREHVRRRRGGGSLGAGVGRRGGAR